MDMKSPPPCPNTVTVRRNPPRKARATPSTNLPPPTPSSSYASTTLHNIPSFPIEDILSMDVPQNPKPDLSSREDGVVSENLKVFLRIRPLTPLQYTGAQACKPRIKNAWPQNQTAKNIAREKKKKTTKISEICITVKDSRSVTLSPPSSLQDLKRIKSEVYEGFSQVFSADSSQDEVYERMVKPLVEDFVRGKSGMLAALGPSGSGKTHTVFGCPREPGMVPLALRRIFTRTKGSGPELLRTFYLSMFEIYSERGKGERVFDLSPDGADLCMQQSTIKGLQEVIIYDVAQAESLIARGMFKRATAITNANSQSSRSQCIINIRSAANKFDGDVDAQPNNAVLTIVDLAGAEREKKTGNQGARLLESNFINNTSMVFGLCLRSLLEHQKNPKKPLQKHFQNSLLTRYIRDYLEGKKRMTLILTVKSGEEDYVDTSFLLRQASPYMKIRFNTVEESSNLLCNKRPFQTLPRFEQPKRMKFSGLDDRVIKEGKSTGDDHQLYEQEIIPEQPKEVEPLKVLVQPPNFFKLDVNDGAPLKIDSVDLAERERSNQIMQDFAKALWNVLKQYKKRLEVTENEVHSLRGSLRNEKTRYFELEKELKDLKSCCSCWKEVSVEAALVKQDNSESRVNGSTELEGHGSSSVLETNVDNHSPNIDPSECKRTLSDFIVGQDQDVISQMENSDESDAIDPSCLCVKDFKHQNHQANEGAFSSSLKGSECDVDERNSDITVRGADVSDDSCLCVENFKQQNYQKHESFPGNGNDAEDLNELKYLEIEDNYPNADVTGSRVSEPVVSCSQSLVMVTDDRCSSVERDQLHSEKEEKLLDPQLSPKEDVTFTQGCNISNVPEGEPKLNSRYKPLNVLKPKRRLLPASSVLLKDISGLELEDENEKPKGRRGEKKLAADERKRTQGSISLLQLLTSNLHL